MNQSAQDHLAKAAEYDKIAQESWERSDTDGFLTQWASGLAGQRERLAASIAEDDGRYRFQALFDLKGNLIAAKKIETAYGMAWGILESDDPKSRIVEWFNPSKASNTERRIANNAKKGYYVGWVMANAKADFQGRGKGLSGTAWVAAIRTDGGFSRDVIVVDNGIGE